MATTVDRDPAANKVPQNDEIITGVASPEPQSEGLKRKASTEQSIDENESTSKRPRSDSSHARETATTETQRKTSSVQDEKKRNRRLFGGLLSTLSQSTASNPAQKRRLEIERRQQERLQKQREEDERLRKEKGDHRRTVRVKEGIAWEEEVMKNRHRRILESARFLKTKARPTVYYLPFKRSAKHDELIEDQIRRTQKLIEREEDDFEERRRKHEEQYGRPSHLEQTADTTRASMDLDKEDIGSNPPPQQSSHTVDRKDSEDKHASIERHTGSTAPQAPVRGGHGDHGDHDESGDEVVDAEEDMVIY